MDKILGIVNLHSDSSFGPLTSTKNIATTSFLGRYYFLDFALSRFANCDVNSIEILVKDKPTSLYKHLSVGANQWAINPQIGGINLMYNELDNKNKYLNTDFNNLLAHKKYLRNYTQAFVVVAPCDIISNIDYQDMLEDHIMSGKSITIAYKNIKNDLDTYKSCDKALIALNETKKRLINLSKDDSCENVYMQTFMIHRTKLIEILDNFKENNEDVTFKDIINYAANLEDVNVYEYKGNMRYFRSLENYVEYSMDLLNSCNYNDFFNNPEPIYTRDFNTPPTVYGKNCNVSACYIANGCKINGNISNSILGRNIIIDESTTIKNSIIFSGVHIEKGCLIENAIIENGALIKENTKILGTSKKSIYIKS